MHYNAGQRIKHKRRISIQGIFLIAILLMVGLAVYLALNNNQANIHNTPPATHQKPA